MYVGYWLANINAPLLSFADGLRDSLLHRVVTFRLEDWLQEMAWMFFCFSVGVWCGSVSPSCISRAPRMRPHRMAQNDRRVYALYICASDAVANSPAMK